MKRFALWSLFVMSLFLSGCAVAAPLIRPVIALPDPLKIAITGVVLWVVSWAFAWLATKLPWIGVVLAGYKQPLAMLIAAALISFIEASVPDAYGAVAVAALELILVLLALFGIGARLKESAKSEKVRAFFS